MAIDESHPVLNIPKTDITIWRYMDIPSFLSLLTNNTLVFIRGDLFEDKFEGTIPELTAHLLDIEARKEIEDGKINRRYWNFSDIINKNNKDTYINCWSKESHEMVHMWKIYSKEDGIAIESKYSKLKKSISTKEVVYPTEVKYVDFKNVTIDWENNILKLYTLKRFEYKSENEFRLLISHRRILEDKLLEVDFENRSDERSKQYYRTPVIHCEVDIKELISEIHLSPYAPKWYLKFLKDLTAKYGLEDLSITQSDL
jgi:hypothetical protein